MSGSPEVDANTGRSLRSGSTRNPRRRQRQSDGESLRSTPRRKRSKISEDTFVAPRREGEIAEEMETEEGVNGFVETPTMNGELHTTSSGRGRGRPIKESSIFMDMDIPLRGKRNSIKRPTRADGATILTQNAKYTVKLLPSTPKDLRKVGVEWRGALGAGHYALAVTRDRAYIWDYSAHSPVSNSKVFDVPFPVKPNDAVPFGALVTSGASTDIGLVLISAVTGRVVFYESIERAASLGLFQDRNAGIEGSIGSLFSGEVVTDIVSAHHAGFIVTLSSGRIAQLTLRDAQGKARIFSHFLRATEQAQNGLLGSIKGILGAGSWKRDVAAVHTRQLGTRGQMQVLSLTERAELQVWDLDWSGQYTFKSTLDFREVVAHELQKNDAPELQGKHEHLTALDFALLERTSNSNEVATVATGVTLDILLLLRAGRPDDCEHVLANVVIEGSEVAVPQLLKVSTYHSNSTGASANKARLLLPRPRHTALLVFEDALVLKELDQSDANSPEAQLHASYIQPSIFEDTVHLKQDKHLRIVGACEEDERGSVESALAFVVGAGLVRLSINESSSGKQEDRIPIKNKIEQAVFHGALQDGNIIDFLRSTDDAFPPEDVEEAALDISSEIVRSKSSYISTTPTSMDTHFSNKAQALRALVNHVRQTYPTISKGAMWQLLWDAEKVAAAQNIWRMFEEHVAASDQTKRIAALLNDICAMANQELNGDSEHGKVDDAVRRFFLQNLNRLDKLLTLAEVFLRDLRSDHEKSSEKKLRLIYEADDLWNTTLGTVYDFRNENAAVYGILPEFIEDGVLIDVAEYADLQEPWTCTNSMLKAAERMAQLSRSIVREEFEASDAELPLPVIKHINDANPPLIESMCRIYQERINWLATRPADRDREFAEQLRNHYNDARRRHLRDLADIAQAEAGMRLAEKYRDMNTLTEMVLAEMQFSVETYNDPTNEDRAEILRYIDKTTARISTYFDLYGEEFANVYFDTAFSNAQAGSNFRDAQRNWEKALTKYLRADASRAKLCWINDVMVDQDFGHASDSLAIAANEQESMLWSKKVELSLGKLSLLANHERRHAEGLSAAGNSEMQYAAVQGGLEVVAIQEQLYRHFLPEIQHCIDEQAELEVAMKKFGFKNQDLHALRQLLETYVDRVLRHLVLSADELIDVLTTMDNVITDDVDDRNLQGIEFYLALKVLDAVASSIPQDRAETLLQLIWKRCYIYDDWFGINSSQKQVDGDVRDKLQDTAAWRTIYHAIEKGYLSSPDSQVRLLLPSECFGAGCRPEDLTYRWSSPDLLDPILKDNKIQDEQLLSYVADRRLDEWVEMCVDGVKRALEDRAEQTALKLGRERDFETSLSYGGINGHHEMNGHALGDGKMNGDLLGADGEGDVQMD